MQPDNFLVDRIDGRPWSLSHDNVTVLADAGRAMQPGLLWLGEGDHALEIATVRASRGPTASEVRAL